jgi:hypothetical protein
VQEEEDVTDASPTPDPAAVSLGTNQAGAVRARWAWTAPEVWTPRMLTALERGVTGGRWYTLMDKVSAVPTLRAAFARVKANRGAAGVDHVTVAMYDPRLDAHLAALSMELRVGRYRPQPIRRHWIPKGPRERRPLGIPTVRDRVVQTALRLVMEPIVDVTFAPHSYGFRRGAAPRMRCAGSRPCCGPGIDTSSMRTCRRISTPSRMRRCGVGWRRGPVMGGYSPWSMPSCSSPFSRDWRSGASSRGPRKAPSSARCSPICISTRWTT